MASLFYSPPSLYAKVARSDWKSFSTEIHCGQSLARVAGPPTTRTQGVAPATRATASKGSASARRHHPPAGNGNHRLRSGDDRAVRARARVRISFW
ncbi:hypothetical protein BHE74_00043562 [Ensete ventricosum]|nr:hypothetical protein BHE74_00043562 [Ensete ventricosum]